MFGYHVEQFSKRFAELKNDLADIATPSSLDELESEPYITSILGEIDTMLIASASRYGSVYGFAQEQGGKTVQNLFPIKQNESMQISSSSGAVLEMHTETAFHPWRPEVLLLLCVRSDSNAGTNVALLSDIIPLLDKECIRILHMPEFVTRIDESFQSESQPDRELLTPIFFDGATSMTYDRALMTSITDAGKNALRQLSETIDKVKTTIYLKTGEVLVLNNRVAVHGRTPFKARYDGTDRWIKRAMVSTKLPDWNEMEIRNGRYRVVTTQF